MKPTFIPLWFNIQSSFYYIRGNGQMKTDERPSVNWSKKDLELYEWLVANVGPAHAPLDNLPIKGDGWEMVGSQSTRYPFSDGVSQSGVHIDDEMLAVQLKCSGVLDDRPEDPILKLVKEMQIQMAKFETRKPPIITVDSLSELTPVSRAIKSRELKYTWDFRDIM